MRIPDIDVLRGFALLGVLLVNALLAAGPGTVVDGGPRAGTADRAVAWLVSALVAGKFYVLLSFLFGYGFTLQQRAAERAGAAFAPRHLRRTATLFALGAVHAVLLFPGDILTLYGALALPLFALRGASPRTALRIAAGLLGAVAVVLLLHGLLMVALTEPGTEPATVTPPSAAGFDPVAARRGDPAQVIAAHVHELHASLAANLFFAPDVFAAFLAGLAAGRRGLLADGARHREGLRRIVRVLLPPGLAGGAFMAVCTNGPLDERWFSVGRAVGVLTAPALSASYACALLLLVRSRRGRWTGELLASAGRVSLTCYLTQSLCLALVFTGYGLGLYDRVGAGVVVAGCVGLYGVQLAVSRVLLRRFAQGPVEYVLRAATGGWARTR